MTIARTVGLQTALDAKQATITTATDLTSKSLTTNDLVVNESLNIDNVITYEKYKQFDTIVIRRDVETDTDVINLRELQVWANDINIMVNETNTYDTYTANWFSNKNTAIGDQTNISGLINNFRVRVRDIQWVFQNEDVFVYKMHDLALSPNLKFKFIHLHEFHNVRCLILVLNCHF